MELKPAEFLLMQDGAGCERATLLQSQNDASGRRDAPVGNPCLKRYVSRKSEPGQNVANL